EVNIDSAIAITDFENVQSIPLFLFFKDGEKRKSLTMLGSNVQTLETNVKTLVTEVNMAKLVLDNIVESEPEPESEPEVHEPEVSEPEVPEPEVAKLEPEVEFEVEE